MKKILAMILVIALVPMSAVAEEVIQAETVQNNVDLLPGAPTDVELDTSSHSALANCNSKSSGSLGGISSAFKDLVKDANWSSALSSLRSGNTGGVISAITGGSQTGQIISSLLGGSGGSISSSLGNIAGNLLSGNGLGNIGSSVTSLISGGGLSALTSGPLGLVSGFLGGVPVNDSQVRSTTQKIQGNTQKIQADQDTQLEVTCVQNVLVSKVSQQFAAENSKNVLNQLNTGNGGTPGYSQNPGDDIASLTNTVFTNLINELPESGVNNPHKVQQYLDEINKAENKNALKCPIENVDLKHFTTFENFADIMAYNPQCTDLGAYSAANSLLYTRTANRLAVQEEITKTSDIYPAITCNDEGGEGKPLNQCEHFIIKSPSSINNSVVQRAVNAGYDQQARATQIGQLVDPLFAQIGQQVLTSLTGLVGLSEKSSTGKGSYLDTVAGTSQNSAITPAKTSLRNSVNNALEVEYAYQVTLADMLWNLENTKDTYSEVQACYKTLVTRGGTTSIDLSGATLKMNQASSTILTVIEPQIQIESNALDDSEGTVASLEALQEQVAGATTATEINALSDAFNGLRSYSTLHTENDLAQLTNDRDASKTLLDGMTEDANTELNQCKNY
ncbi:MAG: hypothetical protein V4449_00690 [Patescibacteria group bacterium]